MQQFLADPLAPGVRPGDVETLKSAKLPQHVLVLKQELERRQKMNRRYSLRAFARFLDMDASGLSRVLAGKQELSLSCCLRVLKKLKLDVDQRMQFMASVTSERRRRATSFFDKAFGIGAGGRDESLYLASTPDYVYVVDRSGRFLYANDALAAMSGHAPAELIGKRRDELDTDSAVSREIERRDEVVFTEARSLQYELSFVDKGRTRWVEKIANPVLDESGKVVALVAAVRDITERRHAADEQVRVFQAVLRGETVTSRIVVTREDGSAATLELTAAPQRNELGDIIGGVATFRKV
ncbi:MAG: PAS domain-containing protein [Deltaproteobacteria bacterium]|nr:PAS domain-containing protein [Deltaproteobacteria bacterium]